jgi:pSer/pThr/pTyr-binding forkhead associated (FHA) protein
VILTATSRALEGRQFTFTGKTQCLVGRSRSCEVHVPASDDTVSRCHCLLDIDAPTVTVQDLSSLNGTYVNEGLIGRRAQRLDAEEAFFVTQPKHVLGDGDELRVGDIVFSVRIVPGLIPPGNAIRVAKQVMRQ